MDGNSITKISLRYLRDQMALVGQEPVLFSGTIAENVLLGTTDKTMDDVREACRIANAIGFIEALPQVIKKLTVEIFVVIKHVR